MDQAKFFDLLPDFKRKMLGPPKQNWWSREYWDVSQPPSKEHAYDNKKGRALLKDTDLIEHFRQVPRFSNNGNKRFGSFGMPGVYVDEQKRRYIKRNVIDLDDEEVVSLFYEKLFPVFEAYGIDHIVEYGGNNLERRKIWYFFTDVTLEVAVAFTDQMLDEAGITSQDLGGEMFPVTRPDGLVRIPLGYYSKRKQVYPFSYGDVLESKDPIAFMQAVIDCKPLTEEWILSKLREPIKEKKEFSGKDTTKVVWLPLDLEPPQEFMPPFVRLCATQCPAIHHLITKVIEDKTLNKRIGVSHMTGLYLAGLGDFNDKFHGHDWGKRWFEELVSDNRDRDAESHKWDYYWGQGTVPMCKTFERDFGKCAGCPQKDRAEFDSPKQFQFSRRLERKKIGDVTLKTAEEVRATTFVALANDIRRALGLPEKT